jgi:hypothetical protein
MLDRHLKQLSRKNERYDNGIKQLEDEKETLVD